MTTIVVGLVVICGGCGDHSRTRTDSARALPPVYPGAPAANPGWDRDAGSVMITSLDNGGDTVAVVVPDVTDSTVSIIEALNAPVTGLTFDLFGRSGRVASAVRALPLPPVDTAKQDCYGWPLARLVGNAAGWSVGFTSGRAQPIALDSIESLHSVDSASLAAALARAAGTVPSVSDPTFRGLPFRVRSAFTFRIDSVDVVIGDVVRVVNEEANPRIEHILLIAERAIGSTSPYVVRYSNRTAGKEESTQASELLAVIAIGESKRPAMIVSIDYSEGNRIALLERVDGDWRATWRSAYTDC